MCICKSPVFHDIMCNTLQLNISFLCDRFRCLRRVSVNYWGGGGEGGVALFNIIKPIIEEDSCMTSFVHTHATQMKINCTLIKYGNMTCCVCVLLVQTIDTVSKAVAMDSAS